MIANGLYTKENSYLLEDNYDDIGTKCLAVFNAINGDFEEYFIFFRNGRVLTNNDNIIKAELFDNYSEVIIIFDDDNELYVTEETLSHICFF